MTTNFRRIALLTGVSAAALGISNVTATAALALPSDTLADGSYPGDFTGDSVIEICELANNPTGPTPPCFIGTIDTGTPVATVSINTFAEGQAQQTDPLGTIYHTGATAEFGAVAIATNGAGDANADHAGASESVGDTVVSAESIHVGRGRRPMVSE